MPDPLSFLSSVSAHRDRPGDTSNLNPDFAAALARAIQQAQAIGLPVSLLSAYRDDKTTGSRYDAGGYSSHGYGLASDIAGLDGPNGRITKAWAQIAEANGLHNPYGVGNKSEYNHWQWPALPLEQTPEVLAQLQKARAEGGPQAAALAYNAPSRPVSPTPGVTLSSPMDIVINAESTNRNIPQQIVDKNTERGTPAGGYLQIIDPTWQKYAPLAGVDVKQYPTAMSAPRNVQIQGASAIPVNQWGPKTVAKLQAAYPNLDTSKTLGEAQSAFTGATPGVSLATAAPPAATGGSGLMGHLNQLANASAGKDENGNDQQQEPQQQMQLPPTPARNVSTLLAQPDLYLQRMAALMQPLQWGSGPPGQNPWEGYGLSSMGFGNG